VHLLDPVAKTVHDHSANDGMISIQRISCTAVVSVARAVLFENVIGAVIDSPEANGWTIVVAFGRVIEDDVENDLDSRAV